MFNNCNSIKIKLHKVTFQIFERSVYFIQTQSNLFNHFSKNYNYINQIKSKEDLILIMTCK